MERSMSEKLEAEVARLKAQLFEAQQAILKEGLGRNDAVEALRPFAALGDVCDRFKKLPDQSICSWTEDGARRHGPTADDCRHARTIVLRFESEGARK
jgi:hypothetical protein